MKVLHDLVQGLAESWLLVFAILVTITAVVLYLRSRKQILFESWINMYDSTDSDTGRSVGDLLLFKIGFIKNVHERSAATYEPDYPEGANDLAALLLEPGYAGRNVPEALRYHHEALELLREPEQENQRKKLCARSSAIAGVACPPKKPPGQSPPPPVVRRSRKATVPALRCLPPL